MKIYTKGGDLGETGLYANVRVAKDDLRIRCYGTLDEANAILGAALNEPLPRPIDSMIPRLQAELFQLGAELATPRGKSSGMTLIGDPQVEALEKEIDGMEQSLPPLKTFILPGGTRASSAFHLARTVVRRAERELVTLHRQDPQRGETLRYLNRLSDALFVVARFCNHSAGIADIPWIAP